MKKQLRIFGKLMMLDPEILLWKEFDRGRMVARFWQNGGAKLAEE